MDREPMDYLPLVLAALEQGDLGSGLEDAGDDTSGAASEARTFYELLYEPFLDGDDVTEDRDS